MATGRRLFGTDGVRGEVGTFLTAELATALGRAAAFSLDGERPQVLIVRDTRESGPMLESALAAGIAAAGRRRAARRSPAHAGGRDLGQEARLRPRRGRLRLPQSLSATTGSSSSPRPAPSSMTMPRRGSRRLVGADAEPAAAPGRVRELNGGLEDYLRALQTAFPLDLTRPPGRARLRQRRHLPRRAGDLRAARRRGRGDRRRARRAQHQRRLRLDPSRDPRRARRGSAMPRSASPSTATATGCWPSTAAAASTTATS